MEGLALRIIDETEVAKMSVKEKQQLIEALDEMTDEEGNNMEQNNGIAQGWVREPVTGQFFPFREQLPPTDNIPAGVYGIGVDRMRGPFFQSKEIATDRLIMVEGSAADQVLREIKVFEERKKEFAKRGFLHKRGIMLCGEPGSGKTATINMVSQAVIHQMHGVVMYFTHMAWTEAALPLFRKLEPHRLVVGIIEDIDNIVNEGDEEELLALLDGGNQVDNIVYIATTNYPEKLPPRIWDRPSRFDTIVYVELPPPAVRAEFLRDKEPEYTVREIEQAVKETEGFTIAHLKEFIILNRCFGKPIDIAAKRIRDTRNNKLFKKAEK